jgi:hypothetical protein
LFPALCKPTAAVDPAVLRRAADVTADTDPDRRGLTMPRRTQTRKQSRAQRIQALRALNEAYVAERNKPPPF